MSTEVHVFDNYDHYYSLKGREISDVDTHNRVETILTAEGRKGIVIVNRYDVSVPTKPDWTRTVNHAIVSYRDLVDTMIVSLSKHIDNIHASTNYEVIYDSVDDKVMFVEFKKGMHPHDKGSKFKILFGILLGIRPYVVREELFVQKRYIDKDITKKNRFIPIYEMYYDRQRDILNIILERY